MKNSRLIRHAVIAAFLVIAMIWSMAEAQQDVKSQSYPEKQLLVTGKWLRDHQNDEGLVIVDVRDEKQVEKDGGKYISGAIHLPWEQFRTNDAARHLADIFIGIPEAQKILGHAGIARNSTVVVYDSVKSDGGATASYLFWVLDLLGHENIHLLERGIDSWIEAGGSLADTPRKAKAVLYQAPAEEVQLYRQAREEFIYNRLGDTQYLILDVRSREEYLGEKPNMGLTGSVLKLGHIPTAVNVDYRLNWIDSNQKTIKPYSDLQELYRGFDPSIPVIVYCHSGRRSSFTYFILRLMGFDTVILYDNSWNGWGRHSAYFPVETRENKVGTTFLPDVSGKKNMMNTRQARATQTGTRQLESPKGGYVSCGG